MAGNWPCPQPEEWKKTLLKSIEALSCSISSHESDYPRMSNTSVMMGIVLDSPISL